MTWEVEYTDQFGEDHLGEEENEAVTAAMNVLEQEGLKEPIPLASDIRVLFPLDPRRAALLLIGGDKSGEWNTWYDRIVPVADDLFGEHLASSRVEEPLCPKPQSSLS